MKPRADEIASLGDGLFVWSAYDRESKVDLWSSAVGTSGGGCVAIDPIDLTEEALSDLPALSGIVITNANHLRASATLARRWGVPILTECAGLEILRLEGGAEEEICLLRADGAVIVGDALINLPSHPFSILPDKYCADPKRLRESLRALAARSFSKMLFAHGEPILSGARERLIALLDNEP